MPVAVVTSDADTSSPAETAVKREDDQAIYKAGKSALGNCFGLLNYKDPEARGYILLGGSRGFAVITGVLYITLAVDTLAERLQNCDGRVDIGLFSPTASQIVPLAATIEAICTATISPVFGAYADLSPKRKEIYVFVQSVWAGVAAFQVILLFFNPTPPVIALLFVSVVMLAVFYELGYIVHFSLLPEIGKGDDHLVVAISSKYYILLNLSQVLCVVLISGASLALDIGTILTAQLAGISVVITCAIFSYLGLKKIQPRPASETLEGNESKYAIVRGFYRLYKTLKQVYRSYSQVLIFLVGFMSLMSTVSALVTLSPVYFRTQLGISPSIIQFVILVSLVMTVPGAAIGNYLKNRVSIKRLMQMIALLWCIFTVLSPLILKGRPMTDEELLEFEQNLEEEGGEVLVCNTTNLIGNEEESLVRRKRTSSSLELILSIIVSACLGIGIGSSYPVLASAYSLIIPGGQEAEFFGLRTFLLKIGSFIPPLIFYAVVENNGLDIAYLSLSPFMFVGLLAFTIFNTEKAVGDVQETMHLRHGTKLARLSLYGTQMGEEVLLTLVDIGSSEEEGESDQVKGDTKEEQ